MISILLIILKIIGITLLVILGLVLLVLFLVLFVPVRYRAEGSFQEAFHCNAKVTWLLHLISVRINVEEKVTTTIRILGIPLSVFVKKKEQSTDAIAMPDTEGVVAQTDGGAVAEEIAEKEMHDAGGETTAQQSQIPEENFEDKKPFFDKILDKVRGIIEKIKDVLNKIRDVLVKIKDFIENIDDKKKTLKRYFVIIKSDTAKAAFSLCKKRLFIMIKHIFPRKMLVDITYGLEDPANTGYILGVYGVLPAFVGKKIVLHPDFDKQIFQCNFHMKGAIRMWTLLYQLLRVIFDENCRKLYYIVKKEISNERK